MRVHLAEVFARAGPWAALDIPLSLRRAPNGAPHSEGLPPGKAMAKVFIKEVWPPALGPLGDDVFDIEPGWGAR